MSQINKKELTEGKVGKLLLLKTIPMVIAMFAMIGFSLVDAFFVGKLGTKPLAALSFTFPVIYFITGISLGLGTGASAVISKAIGKGDPNQVRRLTTDSLILAFIIVSIFITIGILTFKPLFTALGADSEVLPHIERYMYYWYPGMLFVVIPMVGNSATRATGDTKTPSMIMIFSVLVNIVLDPILIFGLGPIPRLEIAGAAIASVIAKGLTLLLSLWILIFRDKMITFKFPPIKELINSWKSILYIGLPSAGTNVIIPIGAGVLTGLIAAYGKEAVAAFGVATRIDALGLSVMMALGSVLGPFIGQNLGAGKLDRLNLGIKVSQRFAIIWGFSLAALFTFFSYDIALLFDNNPKVAELLSLYLVMVTWGYGLTGVLMVSGVSFNVLNKPLYAAVLSLTRMFLLLVPMAYIGSFLFGLSGIYIAGLSANIIGGTIGYIWLKSYLSKNFSYQHNF